MIQLKNPHKYPIRPESIFTGDHFWNAFDDNEMAISAHWIVTFCQKNGNWVPFTYAQLNDFYKKNSKVFGNFRLNGLDTKELVQLQKDGRYFLTHEFICRCFTSSPNPQMV